MSGEAQPAAARPSYWLTRFVFLRLLGLVYIVAFLVVVNQWQPAPRQRRPPARGASFLERGRETRSGPGFGAFLSCRRSSGSRLRRGLPGRRLVGLGLSLRRPLRLRERPDPGRPLAALHVLRPRRPDLLRLRLGDPAPRDGLPRDLPRPLWRLGPFPARTPPSPVVIVLLRWLVFRLMLGAGLIKLRGDPCWRDLTCLVYHYETQPNPNPLSWYFHQLPAWFHELGVALQPRRRAGGAVLRLRPAARAARRGRPDGRSSRSC